jgi:hypothetical protein
MHTWFGGRLQQLWAHVHMQQMLEVQEQMLLPQQAQVLAHTLQQQTQQQRQR